MLIDESVGSPVPGLLTYSGEGNPEAFVVLCGANPFLGGRPDNPVARAMAESLARRGVAVFAWEYAAWRPTLTEDGYNELREAFWKSAEPDGRDVADCLLALDYVRALDRRAPVFLAGYSYGAGVAMLAGAGESLPVLAVSPPLRTLPADFTMDLSLSALAVAEDDIASTREEEAAFECRCGRGWGVRRIMEGEDHFGAGLGGALDEAIGAWLTLLAGRR
jgi:alpha/beta superfamily hydrolase